MSSFNPYFSSTLDQRRLSNSNTWGFSRKIGEHTFGDYHWEEIDHQDNTKFKNTWSIADRDRAKFRNGFRVLTNILDVGGYIPAIGIVAGIIRIIAASILGQIVEKKITDKVFCGQLADEARRTYKAQITRGVLEMLPVLGTIINLSLDSYWYYQWGKRPVGNLHPKDKSV